MSSFYDDASLVVIPSGYKTSKVYAEKPTDGSGDLAFTRTGDTATRVNSAGLIEKVRTNLLLQSNTFNTTWTTPNVSVTGGQTDPDGGTTAWLVTETVDGGSLRQAVTATGSLTFSFILKANTGLPAATLFCTDASQQAAFDLSNGTFSASGAVAKMVSLGNGWYRCSISFTASAASTLILFPSSGAGIGSCFATKAQLETSDIATDYIPTTTAAVSVGPVANVPRLDYLGSTCPRLLLEPQRTNLVTYSEQLNNAAWGNAAAVTANSVVSPDGYQNADTVTGILSQLISFTNGTAYTFSVFAKKNSGSTLTLRADATSAQTCDFNLDTLVASAGGTITNYGNGWYRCAFTFTANGTATGVAYILPPTSVYLYGAQLEAGAYATSYIPTLAASATRGADLASKSGISSLIGQTEGTIFAEIEMVAGNGQIVILTSAAGNEVNRVQLYIDANRKIGLYRGDASVNILSANSYAVGTTLKIAGVYKANDYALYINGVSVGTDTSATAPVTPAVLYLGQYVDGSKTTTILAKQTLLFPTRLTNASLAELTSL